MSGEVSEALLISRKRFERLAVFPIGPGSLARAISDELKVSMPLANSYVSIFSKRAFNTEMMDRIEKIAKSVDQRWQEEWKKVFSSPAHSVILISEDKYIPVAKALVGSITEGRITVFDAPDKIFLPKSGSSRVKDSRIDIIGNMSSSLLALK
jgi:hypothetical protein